MTKRQAHRRKRFCKAAAFLVLFALSCFAYGLAVDHRDLENRASATPAAEVIAPLPAQCMDGTDLTPVLMPPGWQCAQLPVGGYLANDPVCIPHRGCRPVPGAFLTLVAKYFQPGDQRWAVRTSACESWWVETADNHHGDGGDFQQDISDFPAREAAAIKWWAARGVSWSGRGVFNGESNTATSAWLYYTAGRAQWACSGRG